MYLSLLPHVTFLVFVRSAAVMDENVTSGSNHVTGAHKGQNVSHCCSVDVSSRNLTSFYCNQSLGCVDIMHRSSPDKGVMDCGENSPLLLNVSYNSLPYVGADTLSCVENLIQLDTSHNVISTIHVGAFYVVPKLKYLDISNNLIITLDSHLFSPLSQLRVLNISHNPLDTLHPSLFANLTKLEILIMSYTNIKHLHHHLFQATKSATWISLQGNNITTISAQVTHSLKSMHKLNHVNIAQNPLSCDCNLLDFYHWFMSLNRTFSAHNNGSTREPTCDKPLLLAGVALRTLSARDLCSTSSQNSSSSSGSSSSSSSSSKKKMKERVLVDYTLDRPTRGPIVYDPMLGWKTGAALSSMLAMFLVYCMVDKLKRMLRQYRKQRQLEKKAQPAEQSAALTDV